MMYNYLKCHNMKVTVTMLLLFCSSIMANAQQQEPCGTDALMEQLYLKHPELRKEADKSFYEARGAQNSLASKGTAQKRIVPVVVHVVYKSATDSVSVIPIKQMINRFNLDFQKLNSDTSQIAAIFKPLAGGMDVEFRLALIDPAGNPTNGITYTKTTANFNGGGDYNEQNQMKFTATGGRDAWNVRDYLNVWVCAFSPSNLGGYAYLAESAIGVGPRDGIVLKYTTVSGTSRTLTHEAGHYFGLRHTFAPADGLSGGTTPCAGMTNNTCASEGDRICDTPPVTQANGSTCTPDIKDSCIENINYPNIPSTNLPDNISNYMDYTSDNCQNMFTHGQVGLMDGFLNSTRLSLALNAHRFVGPIDITANDAAIFELTSPMKNSCQAPVYPSFRMRNYGTDTIRTAKIRYSFDNGPSKVYTYSGKVAPTELTPLTLPRTNLEAGNHTLYITIDSVNGVADQYPDNSNLTFTFSISEEEALPLSHKQGFECSAEIAAYGWQHTKSDVQGNWERTAAVSGYNQSKNSIVRKFYSDRDTEKGMKDRLISPMIDLASESPESEVYLKFSYAYVVGGNSAGDRLNIYVSRGCGTVDTLIRTKYGYGTNKAATLGTAPPYRFELGVIFVPTADEWLTDSINLKSFIGDRYINILFETVSNAFSTLYLDDILIISPGKPVRENCAGVDLAAGDFILYPNPAASSGGVFTLESGQDVSGAFEVQVFNAVGQAVANYSISDGRSNKRFDFVLPELNEGVYFVRLFQNNEPKETHKLIVRGN